MQRRVSSVGVVANLFEKEGARFCASRSTFHGLPRKCRGVREQPQRRRTVPGRDRTKEGPERRSLEVVARGLIAHASNLTLNQVPTLSFLDRALSPVPLPASRQPSARSIAAWAHRCTARL